MPDQTDHEARVAEAEAAYSDLTCRIIGAYDQSDEMAQRIVEWERALARFVAAVAAWERARCREVVMKSDSRLDAANTLDALEPQA